MDPILEFFHIYLMYSLCFHNTLHGSEVKANKLFLSNYTGVNIKAGNILRNLLLIPEIELKN